MVLCAGVMGTSDVLLVHITVYTYINSADVVIFVKRSGV